MKIRHEHLQMWVVDSLGSVYTRAHVFYYAVCRLEAEVSKLKEEAKKYQETLEKDRKLYNKYATSSHQHNLS
jgi:hypothetical protein